jgi:hypothetical protein
MQPMAHDLRPNAELARGLANPDPRRGQQGHRCTYCHLPWRGVHSHKADQHLLMRGGQNDGLGGQRRHQGLGESKDEQVIRHATPGNAWLSPAGRRQRTHPLLSSTVAIRTHSSAVCNRHFRRAALELLVAAAEVAEQAIDRRLKVGEGWAVLIPQRGHLEKPPQPLDQVEIGRFGRQKTSWMRHPCSARYALTAAERL